MKVAIIKYNAGNIQSVDYALQRLDVDAEVTDDYEKIKKADKVIFPGVGEASTTMSFLRDRKMDVLIQDLNQPVLGICLGMQLLCNKSEEGSTECIGIFDEEVKLFVPKPGEENLTKVPHMGWNNITRLNSKIFDTAIENQFVYFVHSYYVTIGEHSSAECNYIHPFSAALHKDNYFATQFHPEKSGEVGSKILKNFIELA